MRAMIDDRGWTAVSDMGRAGFRVDYEPLKQRFSLRVSGANQSPTSICNYIMIGFDFVPKPGRYYFNNNGSWQQDSGIIAIFNYNNLNVPSTKWSTGGYVDVESVSKERILGKFNFTATGDAIDTSTTKITSGYFHAYYSGFSGMRWPGP